MVCENLSNISETNREETAVGIEWKLNTGYSPKRRVNWRKTAICALKIELCDYAHLLDFLSFAIDLKRYTLHDFPCVSATLLSYLPSALIINSTILCCHIILS